MTVRVSLDYRPSELDVYEKLVPDQKHALVSSFTLESGKELTSVPVAYSTWGSLNHDANNTIVICHALSGSSNVQDWWGPMMGVGKAFDSSRFFLFCGNVLGSPYGSASPLTRDPKTNRAYGPTFPQTTVRDDVRIHKLVLDALGVQSIALVVGGSLGGFAALEWPLSTPPGYVQNVVPIATSTEHGAWGISWGEAQRQCIYADARFNNGYYLPTPQGQPRKGLAAARIVGMLTYRSSVSFEARFGRKPGKRSRSPNFTAKSNGKCLQSVTTCAINGEKEPHNRNDEDITSPIPDKFTAQDYLDYQGEKFVGRFDANCYISLTQKMDTHDIFRGRKCETMARNRVLTDSHGAPSATVGMETVKSLVVGVDSDMLFTHEQQLRVADAFPDARCVMLRSPDGHDGFLLEFEALNSLILDHLKKECSWIYANPPTSTAENEVQPPVARDSVFGEMETDWK